jgi:hypothetical protein
MRVDPGVKLSFAYQYLLLNDDDAKVDGVAASTRSLKLRNAA